MRVPTFFAVLTLLLPGCRGCDRAADSTEAGPSGSASTPALAELTPADRRGAEDAVVSYYAAVATKNCAEMNKLAFKQLTAQECDKLIEEYHEHNTKFVRIDDVKRDGRDQQAVIVKMILLFSDKEHPTLARASKVGNDWKVR